MRYHLLFGSRIIVLTTSLLLAGVSGAMAQTLRMAPANGPVIVEAEELVGTAAASGGRVVRQEMAGFGPGWGAGAQLFWRAEQDGAKLTLAVAVAETGRYEASVAFTRAPDFGQVEVALDGGLSGTYNGYSARVEPARMVLGTTELTAGSHTVELRVAGRDPLSTGRFVGLDRIVLAPVDTRPSLVPLPADVPAAPPAPSAVPPAEWFQPWTTQDIIDGRIDVSAQYALMRMCQGSLDELLDMSDILSAVKDGSLSGIYIQDQQVPALRARDELGKGWWQLLPSGVDASCITEPAARPPIIVLRKGGGQDKHRFDSALRDAWRGCGLPASEPRACIQTLPPKQPRVARECARAAGYPTLNVKVLAGSEPVAGAQVTVSGGDAGEIQADLTGAPGLVGFTLSSPGLYSIEAAKPGYDPSYGDAISVAGSCSYSRTIRLGKGSGSGPPCPPANYLRLKANCEKREKAFLSTCLDSVRSQSDWSCEEALPCLALFPIDPTGRMVIACIVLKMVDGTCALAGGPSVLLSLIAEVEGCYLPYKRRLANCHDYALERCG